MFYWFSFFIFEALAALFSPMTVLGKERLPAHGSYILASNHMSNLDPLLIGLAVRRRIAYMAKDALFRDPILRFCLNRVEAFPVKRDAADVRALRETLRRLKKGLPVVVFPEGTRGGTGSEKRTQSGIGFLAVKGRVPVVPVFIRGSDKVLPRGAKFPRRGRVTINLGSPINFTSQQPYGDIVTRIMDEIAALSSRS